MSEMNQKIKKELKLSRSTNSLLNQDRIFPEYTYYDDTQVLSIKLTENDMKKISQNEKSTLAFNFWRGSTNEDQIIDLGTTKEIIKKNQAIEVPISKKNGDFEFCVFTYDSNAKKLASSNNLQQKFNQEGESEAVVNEPDAPWKLIVNENLTEPWKLRFEEEKSQFTIELNSQHLQVAMKRDDGFNIMLILIFLRLS